MRQNRVYLLNRQLVVGGTKERLWDRASLSSLFSPWQLDNSCRSLPNAAINGLSCRLLPLFPLSPQRFAIPRSRAPSPPRLAPKDLLPGRGREGEDTSWTGFGFPPKIDDTEEWAQRGCFRMAEVTDMHSEVTRDTGSTATVTGRLRYCSRGISLVVIVADRLGRGGNLDLESPASSSDAFRSWQCTSRLILDLAGHSFGEQQWRGSVGRRAGVRSSVAGHASIDHSIGLGA